MKYTVTIDLTALGEKALREGAENVGTTFEKYLPYVATQLIHQRLSDIVPGYREEREAAQKAAAQKVLEANELN